MDDVQARDEVSIKRKHRGTKDFKQLQDDDNNRINNVRRRHQCY